MKLIVGLGNPGKEYEKTRHNVGFDLIDRLALRRGLRWEPFKAGWTRRRLADLALDRESGFALLKPLTFMNRSGEAVSEFAKRFKIETAEILSVSDDFALPLGKIRIRKAGSSGGQKGLQSLIDHLGTEEFPRLRLGIGERKGEAPDYVLSRFSKAESKELEQSLESAVDALEYWLSTGDIEQCMNRFH